MNQPIINKEINPMKVQVELSAKLLKQLLKTGVLHGDECKCLNANAKRLLWHVLLTTSTEQKSDEDNYLCA